MTEGFDMVSYLITVCPALGILAWVVVHFKGEIKKKDEEIESMTNEFLQMTKDQITFNEGVKTILEMYKNK